MSATDSMPLAEQLKAITLFVFTYDSDAISPHAERDEIAEALAAYAGIGHEQLRMLSDAELDDIAQAWHAVCENPSENAREL